MGQVSRGGMFSGLPSGEYTRRSTLSSGVCPVDHRSGNAISHCGFNVLASSVTWYRGPVSTSSSQNIKIPVVLIK